jgi:hypothetical protein
MTPSLKVLMGCLLATACGSQPSSSPHSELVATHDTRRDLLGAWSAEFVSDTVDSFVVEGGAERRVARHSVNTKRTIGTIVLFDSLTPDRADLYARLDGDLLGLLCFPRWKAIPIWGTGDTVAFRMPPGHMNGAWYINRNLFAHGRHYGDSVVGRWTQVCLAVHTDGGHGKLFPVWTKGRWRMLRAGSAR